MRAKSLQLVLPSQIHASYTQAQRAWLMDLNHFMALAKGRQ
jgi:hypothetical protein